MAGADNFDATAPNQPVPRYSQARNEGSKRVAYFADILENEAVDKAIRNTTHPGH